MEDKIFVVVSVMVSRVTVLPRTQLNKSMSTGAKDSITWELFCTKVDIAYKVLCVEYPLHRGRKYNFP
jgi:hypothetical protein